MSIDYKLVHAERKVAKIYTNETQVAELRSIGKGEYRLGNKKSWMLSRKIEGHLLPFSIRILEIQGNNQIEILRVKDHLFQYNAYFYMVGGIPESQHPRDHLSGSKHIIKLTSFPHTKHEQVDEETRSRLKRHRGPTVGTIYGLGSKGFHVKLEDELEDIGLPLAAATYLMYSSA